jgi:hypothetical protein
VAIPACVALAHSPMCWAVREPGWSAKLAVSGRFREPDPARRSGAGGVECSRARQPWRSEGLVGAVHEQAGWWRPPGQAARASQR